MAICGFSGRRRSGKSLLANLMQDICLAYGMEKPEILSFATPLKELFCELKGISLEYLLLPNVKEEYRVEMQEFSEQIKAEDPMFFSNKLFEKINPTKNQIIDDVRLFDEELLPLRERKIPLWYVYACYDARRDRGAIFNREVDTSIYEQSLDLPQEIYWKLFDTGYIFNNKSIDELKLKAGELVKQYFLPSM